MPIGLGIFLYLSLPSEVGGGESRDALDHLGEGKGLVIRTMHEDIFNTMHHI